MKPHLLALVNRAKSKNPNLTPERSESIILALDVATKCGWSTEHASGMWDFSIKRDESSGMRLLRFRAKLKETIKLCSISLVVFERTAGRNVGALITQSELHGVLKLFCEQESIPYRAYSAPEIKKFATGKGNSGKPLMVKAAQERWGMKGTDDNEADALHLYHLAKSDL